MISSLEMSRVTRPRKALYGVAIALFWLLIAVCGFRLLSTDSFPEVPAPPPMPSPNAVDTFHSAAMRLKNNGGIVGLIPAGPKAAPIPILKLRAAVRANRKALTEFRQALTMPCQYPVARHPADPMPLYLEEDALAQLVVQEGKVYEADGNWRAAADNYLDVYEFGTKVAAHSSLLNGLVGTVLQSIAIGPLSELLNRCDVATAAHIAGRLLPLYASRRPSFDLIQEEWYRSICRARTPSRTGKWCDRQQHLAYCQSLHLQQKSWEALIAWAKLPLYRRGPAPAFETKSDPVRRFLWGPYYAMAIPLYQSALQDTDNKQVKTQVTLVKAQIVAYRWRHGVYPKTLAELALPPEIVTDPYSDASLIYTPPSASSGDGKVKVYSVGPNQADNGSSQDDIAPGSP